MRNTDPRNITMTHITGWQKKWEGQNFGISKNVSNKLDLQNQADLFRLELCSCNLNKIHLQNIYRRGIFIEPDARNLRKIPLTP